LGKAIGKKIQLTAAVPTITERENKGMKNRIFPHLALFLVTVLLSGCAVIPFLPFIPIMGSAYDVVWKSGKATKYYAFDLDTTYQAVMQASDQLKIETTLIKASAKEGHSLEINKNIPMRIDIIPLEKNVSVTTVVIRISIFGDKQYVELFYSLIDENLSKRESVGKGKPQ
jgi:hypothetical protein